MGKVFISYAREDVQIATRLYKDLKEAGMQPWMDVYNMVGGKRWKAAIEKEIRDSSHVIVLLSSRTLSKRGFVQKEIRQALEIWSETPPEEIYLIPVRVDECVPTHDQLQEIQWVDLFPSYEIGFAGIKRALETSDFIATDSRSRAQITEQLSLLGELVVNAREAIYALDEQGCYYWCNQATLDLMETQTEHIVGRHFLELTDIRDRDMRQARFSSALAGDPQTLELRRTRRDGSISHISVNSVPLIASKSIIGVLEIAHDVTEQPKKEIVWRARTSFGCSANWQREWHTILIILWRRFLAARSC